MAIPFLGALLGKGLEMAGGIADKLIKDKDLAAKFKHELAAQFSSQNFEIQQLEIAAERDMHEAQQKTIQAELHQSDLYTKQTRPKIARQSWYLTIAYAVFSTIGAPLLAHFTAQTGEDGVFVAGLFTDITFQWEVFMAVASPALTYMGVRTFDKWKNGGRS